ncbi:MAG: glycosyltransferase family 4 protein [Candidatus Thermoplasmatota archaeon]
MKNIGILEYHYHAIYLYTLARVCKTNKTTVTIFTTKKIFSLIEPHLSHKEDYTIILKEDHESINHFLKRVQTYCNEHIDLLFVNTIQETLKDLPHFLTFQTRCPMILTIHDANTWLKPTITIDLRKPIRTLDTILSTILIKKMILDKYAAINVVYPLIKDYITQHTTYTKPVFTIPFNFYDPPEQPLQHHKDTSKVTFLVPGEIIRARRDHSVVLDAFEELFPQYPKNISLIILGRPVGRYGKSIIKRCTALHQHHYDITWFTEFVPEKTYIETYQTADVIIAPIQLETHGLGTIRETFGQTKASGAPYEAIQYAKPIILPQAFNLIPELSTSTITYQTAEDLKQKITDLLKTPHMLSDLKSNAVLNAQKFSLSCLQRYFEDNLLNNKEVSW